MIKGIKHFRVNEALNASKVCKLMNVKLSELGQEQIALSTFNAKNNQNSRNTFGKQRKALRMALNIVVLNPNDYVKKAPLGRKAGIEKPEVIYADGFLERPVIADFIAKIVEELKKDCEFLAE